MSSEWISGKLQDFCDITRGASPRPIHDYLGNEGMPWIKIADATAESSRFISSTKEKIKLDGVRASVNVNPGDLILSNSATPGLPKFLRITACIHDGWMLLRNFKQLDKEFAYWLLLSERTKLVAQGNGSVFTNLKTDILKSHVVSLPPLNLQRKIAHSLNALDDRITLLHETNKTLEAIAQAIFKSWFVDFDPVRAKMEGRQPEGMDEATAALFPDSFEKSELGLMPKGWNTTRLDSVLELKYGKALKADNRKPGAIPVYGSGGITGWHDTALVEKPSIIVGRKGTVGSLYWESRPSFPIDTVFYVHTNLPLTYCYQLLKTLNLHDMNTDAAVPGLNRDNVYRLLVPSPSLNVLSAFNEIADSLRRKIDHNEEEAQNLAEIRDTLLPRLISGQLRLPEAQEQIENA